MKTIYLTGIIFSLHLFLQIGCFAHTNQRADVFMQELSYVSKKLDTKIEEIQKCHPARSNEVLSTRVLYDEVYCLYNSWIDKMIFNLLTQDKWASDRANFNQKTPLTGQYLQQKLNRLFKKIQTFENDKLTEKVPVVFETLPQTLSLKKISLEDKRSLLQLLKTCKLYSWETIAKRIKHPSLVNQSKLQKEVVYSPIFTLDFKDISIKDQGIYHTSVAYATTTALEYLQQQHQTLSKPIQLSPKEIYHTIDLSKKNTYKGVYLTDALEHLKQKGAISQQDWKKIVTIGYNDGLEPDKMKRYKIADYQVLYNKNWHDTSELINQLKQGLNEFGPLVTETVLFKNSLTTNKTGIIKEQKNVNFQYLQTICIVGYDDDKQLIKFCNSKGKNWGNKGYGYISYAYAEKYFNYVYALIQ